MEIKPYLNLMVVKGGSDMFFSVGTRPNIKIEGKTVPVGHETLDSATLQRLVASILDVDQKRSFEETLEFNMGFTVPEVGRFRANFYHQRGEVGMVIRHIKDRVPSLSELGMPTIFEELILAKRGLIFVVGATGSGKSTTLAALLDHRNRSANGHILTIEDPIEFIHPHKKSVVDQREVGIDTLSYSQALKNALREAPDLIMIGEIRDVETMQHAIHFAETGHLCLTSMHASNACQAIERVINFFPEESRNRLCLDLSLHLTAILAQRLVPGVEGKRVAAVEVMPKTPYISELIEKGLIGDIRDYLLEHKDKDIQTFDQAVYDLYKAGRITPLEAVRYADSQHNVRMKIEFESPGTFNSLKATDLSIYE